MATNRRTPKHAATYVATEQAAVVGRLSALERTVDAVLLRDRPASGLADDAREFAAGLVIIGSRGRGPIVSLLLGSVSAEVVDPETGPFGLLGRD